MDKITYLTPSMASLGDSELDPLHSRLLRLVSEIKQAKANSAQWLGILNGMTQKGVKAAEIEDSHIRNFLAMQLPTAKIEKDALLTQIARRLPRIKRVDLNTPSFSNYRSITDGQYQERLYILSSEAMVGDDALEDLMYRIEDLGFNPAPLITDPDIVDRLEAEMAEIKSVRPDMYDFEAHHYSNQVKAHGKNLLAHARISTRDDLVFIEEIQSDWAQNGRSNNWSDGYPKAPLVAHTEQWAGVVLRDILHGAAHSLKCKRVAWIDSTMRNGWNRAEGAPEYDKLAVFYSTIVKKLAEKCIEKAGGKVSFSDVMTKNGVKSVMGFDMTDKVRQALQQSLPLYSRDSLMSYSARQEFPDSERTAERAAVVQECTIMLGSAHTIRFVAKLYDASHTKEVAGQYLEKGITLSLRAKHLDRTARHEAWHFAEENFLMPHEKRDMRLAFSFGSELNNRTQDVLRSLGSDEAARQCVDEKECAAHAFSLWCEGRMTLTPETETIFDVVIQSLNKIADWLESKIFGVQVKSPEDMFLAMRAGTFAARERQAELAQEVNESRVPQP